MELNTDGKLRIYRTQLGLSILPWFPKIQSLSIRPLYLI